MISQEHLEGLLKFGNLTLFCWSFTAASISETLSAVMATYMYMSGYTRFVTAIYLDGADIQPKGSNYSLFVCNVPQTHYREKNFTCAKHFSVPTFQYVHILFIITHVCLIYLCFGVCVCECDTEVYHFFGLLFPQHSLHKASWLCQDHAHGVLVSVKDGPTHSCDLSNLQLTPVKVSYDLIETDYSDNSITHNHVGQLNSRLQI